MPLSEDEQRILRQIEQELRSDPTFSRRGYRVSAGRLVWFAIALVIGIGVTIAAVTVHPLLAFVLFLALVGLGILFEAEARAVGRDRFGDVPVNAWLSGVRRRQQGDEHDAEDQ